jgi:hypothetical protein
MNLIEALKRAGYRGTIRRRSDGVGIVLSGQDHFSTEWVLADDWEIEEKRVEVTASQICKAYREAQQMAWHPPGTDFFKTFLSYLGL